MLILSETLAVYLPNPNLNFKDKSENYSTLYSNSPRFWLFTSTTLCWFSRKVKVYSALSLYIIIQNYFAIASLVFVLPISKQPFCWIPKQQQFYTKVDFLKYFSQDAVSYFNPAGTSFLEENSSNETGEPVPFLPLCHVIVVRQSLPSGGIVPRALALCHRLTHVSWRLAPVQTSMLRMFPAQCSEKFSSAARKCKARLLRGCNLPSKYMAVPQATV